MNDNDITARAGTVLLIAGIVFALAGFWANAAVGGFHERTGVAWGVTAVVLMVVGYMGVVEYEDNEKKEHSDDDQPTV